MLSKLLILFILFSGFIIQDSQTWKWRKETCTYNQANIAITKDLFQDLIPHRTTFIKQIARNPSYKQFFWYYKDFAIFAEKIIEAVAQLKELPRRGSLRVRKAFNDFYNKQTEMQLDLISRVNKSQFFGAERFMVKFWEEYGKNKLNLQRKIGKGRNVIADCYGADGYLDVRMAKELKRLNVNCVATRKKMKKYLRIIAKYYRKLNKANSLCLKALRKL